MSKNMVLSCQTVLEITLSVSDSFFFHFCFSVTIARAIELKHKASIVSALAYETARMYQDAGKKLKYPASFDSLLSQNTSNWVGFQWLTATIHRPIKHQQTSTAIIMISRDIRIRGLTN